MQSRDSQNWGQVTLPRTRRACSLGDVGGSTTTTLTPPQRGLVLQGKPGLRVGPEIVQVSDLPASRGPVGEVGVGGAAPESGQVQGSEGLTGLEAVHNPLCQGVQGVVHEAPLSSGKPFPKGSEPPGALGVELTPHLGAFVAVVANNSAWLLSVDAPRPHAVEGRWCRQNATARDLDAAGEGSDVALPHIQSDVALPHA